MIKKPVKRNKAIIVTFLICICLLGVVLSWVLIRHNFTSVGILVKNADVTLKPIDEIKLSEVGYHFDEHGFTCTGMCFDPAEQMFWLGNYGKISAAEKDLRPSIVGLSKDDTVFMREIDVSEIVSDKNPSIQGIAYDAEDDSLWFTDSVEVYHIKKDGTLIGKLDLGSYSEYIPNGVAFDKGRNTLWILFYKKYLIEYTKTGEIKNVFNCDYKDQDHITVENERSLIISVGADYNGQNNYLMRIEKDTGNVTRVFRVQDSYAIEGVCIINSTIYVANNGVFHNAKKYSNSVLLYESGN